LSGKKRDAYHSSSFRLVNPRRYWDMNEQYYALGSCERRYENREPPDRSKLRSGTNYSIVKDPILPHSPDLASRHRAPKK
jgi:hypothetical protein